MGYGGLLQLGRRGRRRSRTASLQARSSLVLFEEVVVDPADVDGILELHADPLLNHVPSELSPVHEDEAPVTLSA